MRKMIQSMLGKETAVFTTKKAVTTGFAAIALALVVAAPAGAGKGGEPNPSSCGLGRSFSQILRDEPELPGASEVRDLSPEPCNGSTKN